MSTKILLAEDETLVAELLVKQLSSSIPGAAITKVRSVRELNSLKREKFDIAVVDLSLADENSLTWLRQGFESDANRRVVVLTSMEEDFVLHRLFQTPVSGIVHKTDGLEFLEMALKTVLAGGSYFSPRIQAMRSNLNANPQHFAKLLSEREQAVLHLIGCGFDNSEIEMELGIKESTVLDHRKNIMRKLDVHSQIDLVAYAISKGFSSATLGKKKYVAPKKTC